MAVSTRWLTMLADLTSWGTALKFVQHWSSKMAGAFFSANWLEPEGRKILLGEFYRRQLLIEIFEAIQPGLTAIVRENLDDPPDDTYVALHHDSLLDVDLYGAEYNERFANAAIYRWRPMVWATQVTSEKIAASKINEVTAGGIHFSQLQGDCYFYRFNEPYATLNDRGELRFDCREVTGMVDEGNWLVKDPSYALMFRKDTRFCFNEVKDEDFWQWYAATAEPGRFRPRAMYRAFRNPTRRNIETLSQRGVSYGDPWSWLIMPYDPSDPRRLGKWPRFPVSFWWFEQFFEYCPRHRRLAQRVNADEVVPEPQFTEALQPAQFAAIH